MAPVLQKRLFYCLFFICLGITTEVFFTAFSDLLSGLQSGNPDWSLTGHTYVWMAFIYVLIPFLFGWGYELVKDFPLLVRLLVYTTFIYVVEFASGWLLEVLTGACPWEYTVGWHVMGYIRLDYFPFWMVFGLILESLYRFLEQRFNFHGELRIED